MKRHLQLLTTPTFLLGLALLLANDFVFKPHFHNSLTGKLSDFAGLFVFTLFWTVFAPRWKGRIFLLTAAGFIFWKSPLAEPLIDAWNSLSLLYVQRVVDWTDLVALAVLPLAFFYEARVRRRRAPVDWTNSFAIRRFSTCAVVLISLFAFTATQRSDEQHARYEKQYQFEMYKQDLMDRLRNIGLERVNHIRTIEAANQPLRPTEYYSLTVKSKFCKEYFDAFVQVIGQDRGVILQLQSIDYFCETHEPSHDDELLAIFEREVVIKLAAKEALREEKQSP